MSPANNQANNQDESPLELQKIELKPQDGDLNSTLNLSSSAGGLFKSEVLVVRAEQSPAPVCFLEKVVNLSGLNGEESELVRKDLSDVLSASGKENENLSLDGLRSMMLKYLDLIDLEMRNSSSLDSPKKH